MPHKISKKYYQKSIVVLICYFGKLPWYFRYFLHSCAFNPSIVFKIITDNPEFVDLAPKNVEFIRCTLDKFCLKASKALNINVKIEHPYKICDLRPAFGIIFKKLIHGYHYWGYGDIDVIYGNIRKFLLKKLNSDFDIISVRHDYLPGCFILFKNTQKNNSLFMQSRDYKKVFSSSTHFCFDETNFSHQAFTRGNSWQSITTEIESMTHVVRRLMDSESIKVSFDFLIVEGLPGRLQFRNGTLLFKNRFEVMLYHLIFFKKKYSGNRQHKKIPDRYNISRTRIYP